MFKESNGEGWGEGEEKLTVRLAMSPGTPRRRLEARTTKRKTPPPKTQNIAEGRPLAAVMFKRV